MNKMGSSTKRYKCFQKMEMPEMKSTMNDMKWKMQ